MKERIKKTEEKDGKTVSAGAPEQAQPETADEYETISGVGKGLYTEKRSKFLAFAHPVSSADEAMTIVKDYRKEFYDARHCCYAYMLGPDRKEFRSNDDGEPSSTAGKPILGQINSHQLTDILVVVVRYYGGVNLGTSGLAVAYRTAAAEAIENSPVVTKTVEETLTYSFAYPMMNDVMRVVKETAARIVSQQFDNTCSVTLAIRRSRYQALCDRLKKLSFE